MARQPRRAKAPAPRAVPEPKILDERGQMWLPLGGTDYCIRPDYQAIEAIEAKLGPVTDLAASASQNRLTIAECAFIVAEMMHAFGRDNPNAPGIVNYTAASADVLGPMIQDASVTRICGRLYPVLFGVVTGGYDASGERKPAAEGTMETASASPPPDAG